MPENRAPSSRLTLAQWTATRTMCLDFIDRFGAEAHRRGWTASELFGVHPEHGTLHLDYCGALMTSPEPANTVEADRIVFVRTAAYRNKPGQMWGPPIRDVAARKQA